MTAFTKVEHATMLDMMANTDCTYKQAVTAVLIWRQWDTDPEYQCYDNGRKPRSVKVGCHIEDGGTEWFVELSPGGVTTP